MADPDWAWRFMSPTSDDGVEDAALRRLHADADRARRWMANASSAIGMPLPVGNGTNGPWHRVALIDADGRFGVGDIAAGRIAWTDMRAPRYVRRFAVEASAASSPHGAGGSGGMGSASAQVALALLHGGHPARISPLPRPNVSWIEYGIRTCYGTCEGAPTPDEYRTEWAALAGVPRQETTTAQSEDLHVAHADALAVWHLSIHYGTSWRSAVSIGRPCAGYATDRTIVLTATGAQRREWAPQVMAHYRAWAMAWAAEAATRAARDAAVQTGVVPTAKDAPESERRYVGQWRTDDAQVQRALLHWVTKDES